MKNNEELVKKIKQNYEKHETTKIDELKLLDKKVKTPAIAFAYIYGIVGSLVLGTGMCLAMKVFANLMPLGIVIGILGIAMVSTTYLIYKKILKSRKSKYANKVLELSDEILNK